MSMDLYESWKPYLTTGDLLSWVSDTMLGWMIRHFGGWCNHSGMVVRLDQFMGLKDRRWTLEFLEHGGEFNLISDRLKEYDGQLWWHKLKDEFTQGQRDVMATWFFLHKGKKYDYGSLFKQAIARVSANAEKLFCSEGVYLAAVAAKIVEKQEYAPKPWELPPLGAWQKGIKIYDSTIEGKVTV